jgi:hypothetical protein
MLLAICHRSDDANFSLDALLNIVTLCVGGMIPALVQVSNLMRIAGYLGQVMHICALPGTYAETLLGYRHFSTTFIFDDVHRDLDIKTTELLSRNR